MKLEHLFLLFFLFLRDESPLPADGLFSLQLLLLFICWSAECLSLSLWLCHSCGPAVMSPLWQSPCFWQCLHISLATTIPHLHPKVFCSLAALLFSSWSEFYFVLFCSARLQCVIFGCPTLRLLVMRHCLPKLMNWYDMIHHYYTLFRSCRDLGAAFTAWPPGCAAKMILWTVFLIYCKG